MQINNFSNTNQQNFNGKVVIIDDLSAVPASFVRKNAVKLKKLVNELPFDLFIKQNHKDDTVSIIAQKEKDFRKNNAKYVKISFNKNADLYDKSAEKAVKFYQAYNIKPTFVEKLKKIFNNLGEKLYKIMTDE